MKTKRVEVNTFYKICGELRKYTFTIKRVKDANIFFDNMKQDATILAEMIGGYAQTYKIGDNEQIIDYFNMGAIERRQMIIL